MYMSDIRSCGLVSGKLFDITIICLVIHTSFDPKSTAVKYVSKAQIKALKT